MRIIGVPMQRTGHSTTVPIPPIHAIPLSQNDQTLRVLRLHSSYNLPHLSDHAFRQGLPREEESV